ncbi:Inner membrane protein YohD [Piscirickettsia salmonis]|uniref:DedA n=1 Tax=Piscirickettsia salmonis TaxID=1238 RepID=A0AAC8ZPQ5_PISSA|nr:DedA family protein [Piscirickettsia salmonis]AKP72641.1 hypothetical protein PSLF89_499 [Piscirickettsia salmonis LF-89 = ATCC VR-1361]ALB23867.1 DedA [Piscirickettsia salmonis]ALY03705.1 hypothetical protein AWE47_13250 [Piscirickettsia salmonis]AMA43268.1 hypothetical protein AWJ11_13475 [Piscirickettsia salmonis]AOS35738.1 hypothetical protein AVM72_10595 [Piscirickettsia salmonis]
MLNWILSALDPSYFLVLSTSFIEATALLLFVTIDCIDIIDNSPYLQLPIFIALATTASTLHNQLFFFLGRCFGHRIFKYFPKSYKKMLIINNLFKKYDILLILGMRCLYGLRIATPIVLGMSKISWLRFLSYDLIGGLIWSSILILAGYYCGNTLKKILNNPNHYSLTLISILMLCTLLVFIKNKSDTKKNKIASS